MNIALWVAVVGKERKAARRHLQRALHQVRRDTHALTVYPGTGLLQDVEHFFMGYIEADVLKHVERAIK